ncbi:phosphatidate cytidylyltransferase [bacterium SCSIO 12741]|nr:phosphatidate cytidylyltransferase [bacterium SCSIO 12741]
MSNFLQRLLTGIGFFIVILGATAWRPESFALLFLTILLAGQLEFYRLIQKAGGKPQIFWGMITGAYLFLSNFWFVSQGFKGVELLIGSLFFIFMTFVLEVFRKADRPFHNIAYTLTGVFYIGLPFSLLNYLVIDTDLVPTYDFSPWVLVGTIMTMWANDSWAYIIGSWLGKNKLYPSVSPGKTWEGFIGGIVFSLLWASLMSLFIENISWLDWLAVGAIVSLFGTAGDLAESKLKRSLQIKDSGNIFPGHGGVLDRFDAFIVAIPFLVLYFYLVP